MFHYCINTKNRLFGHIFNSLQIIEFTLYKKYVENIFDGGRILLELEKDKEELLHK